VISVFQERLILRRLTQVDASGRIWRSVARDRSEGYGWLSTVAATWSVEFAHVLGGHDRTLHHWVNEVDWATHLSGQALLKRSQWSSARDSARNRVALLSGR
jgi:hypothetical protein